MNLQEATLSLATFMRYNMVGTDMHIPGGDIMKTARGGKYALLALFFSMMVVAACNKESNMVKGQTQREVRKPAWAGQFYPRDPGELSGTVEQLLETATGWQGPGTTLALVCPHAGYVYSGQTAAHAFRSLKGEKIDVVILMGAAHHRSFEGVSIFKGDAYAYPGGEMECDRQMADQIREKDRRFGYDKAADDADHCLEVMVPFLAKVLPESKIVPILMGHGSEDMVPKLARAILESKGQKRILLLASTDLSHFPVSDEQATRIDTRTLASWETMDTGHMREVMEEQMAAGLPQLACTMCGYPALFTAMEAAKSMGAEGIHLFPYTNSARVSGQEGRVVGYGAALIYGPRTLSGASEVPAQEKDPNRGWINDYAELSEAGQRKAIQIASEAIECVLRGERWKAVRPGNRELEERRGCFVTLLTRESGELRGCIGIHETDMPLYQAIGDRAIQAAFKDPRFPPLTKEEWPQVRLKISVYLSKVKPVDDPSLFVPGRFGILFKKGLRGSTFLPEVAEEQGWTREETFQMLARKAGLRPQDWREGEFSLYTTQVIDGDDFR